MKYEIFCILEYKNIKCCCTLVSHQTRVSFALKTCIEGSCGFCVSVFLCPGSSRELDCRSWVSAEQSVQESEQVLTFLSGVRAQSKCPSTARNRTRLIFHAAAMIVQVLWVRQDEFRQAGFH